MTGSGALATRKRGWTRRALLVAAGAAGTLPLLRPDAAVGAERRLVFEIRTGTQRVGRHEVRFLPHPRGGFEVRTAIDVRVRFAFLTLYRYRHRVREWWRGGLMRALEVEAENTRERRELVGTPEGDAILVRTPAGVRTIPLGAMTDIAFWNPAIVRQERLLDTWDGDLVRVRGRPGTTDRVTVGERTVEAVRHRLESENGRVADVWYDAAGEWVMGRIRIGEVALDYRRVV